MSNPFTHFTDDEGTECYYRSHNDPIADEEFMQGIERKNTLDKIGAVVVVIVAIIIIICEVKL